MKRYCQTLKLYNDEELIRQYIAAHKEVWTEIKEGIRQVGIVDMQIYILENILFMIMDTLDEFDWENSNALLATLPRQKEWEELMSKFQVSVKGQASHEKWRLMSKIFGLNE
ncbi:MAG: L-rhamnose mutarotase [Bacteroidia bacterium]|nr:L-rhamnose mutarotase [Bacteroidia bacterium]